VPLHDELTGVLDQLGIAYEVILIDDGSEDATFTKLAAIQAADPHVKVVRFTHNFGQTAAFAAGFAEARGQFIVTLDGDLQNDPRDIPEMLALARRKDIVSGWRRKRKDRACASTNARAVTISATPSPSAIVRRMTVTSV